MQITIDLDLIENSTLNEYQKGTLTDFLESKNANTVTITDTEVTKPIEEMDELEVHLTLMRLVVHLNIAKINQEHKERIESGDYTVQVVTSDPPLVYTAGLSLTSGIELAYQTNMDIRFMSDIVNGLAKGIKENGLLEETTSKQYLTGEEKDLRIKLVLVEEKDKLIDKLTLGMGNPNWLPNRPDKVYQVLVGDERNILPGEEGYDETFLQDFDYDTEVLD